MTSATRRDYTHVMSKNPDLPSYLRPLWVRVFLTLGLGAWTIVEAVQAHSPMWMALFALATLYCFWEFIVKPWRANGRPS